MALYHEKVSPVRQILDLQGLPAILAENQTLVLPLAVDYASWSQESDRLSQAIAQYSPPGGVSRRVLYISGRVSPLARSQLEARGFTVADEARAEIYR